MVTGAAGFIGYHAAEALLARGDAVLGVDNFTPYYDVTLKEARVARLEAHEAYKTARVDLADRAALQAALEAFAPDLVIHLAAQAGVRYSVENPFAYVDSNLVGFVNLIELAKRLEVGHFVYAATSSVYGANSAMPFHETHGVAHPMSLYAATKRANEVIAHAYAHLHGLPCTGLRFFTVYGPWGRPDMALFKFTKAILEDRPIDVYNYGKMARDFTYVDDVVEGVLRVADQPASVDPTWRADDPHPDPDRSGVAPFRIYNIGRGAPVALTDFIRVLEEKLQKPARRNEMPMQPGDVAETFADTRALEAAVGYRPATPIELGVAHFVDWYRSYYKV